MINEGHVDYATPEDLDGLSDAELIKVAEICEVTSTAPDECIPCWAYVEFLERKQAKLEDMAPQISEDDDDDPGALAEEDSETPKLDALMGEEPGFIPVEVKRRPYVEILQFQLTLVQNTLNEILHGPPIPPKDVTYEELALLAVAADRWVRMTEAQGVDLSANQQAVLDSTRDLVARLRA